MSCVLQGGSSVSGVVVLYCMVRDQKYLIGKKLRSIPPKHADESSEEALLNS